MRMPSLYADRRPGDGFGWFDAGVSCRVVEALSELRRHASRLAISKIGAPELAHAERWNGEEISQNGALPDRRRIVESDVQDDQRQTLRKSEPLIGKDSRERHR